MKKPLTITAIKKEAFTFARKESKHHESALYGVTDGKAVGTYLEHKFQALYKKSILMKQVHPQKGLISPS